MVIPWSQSEVELLRVKGTKGCYVFVHARMYVHVQAETGDPRLCPQLSGSQTKGIT